MNIQLVISAVLLSTAAWAQSERPTLHRILDYETHRAECVVQSDLVLVEQIDPARGVQRRLIRGQFFDNSEVDKLIQNSRDEFLVIRPHNQETIPIVTEDASGAILYRSNRRALARDGQNSASLRILINRFCGPIQTE